MTPPTTAAAEIATATEITRITINPADAAIAAVSTQSYYYSWGSGRVTEGGRVEAILQGAVEGGRVEAIPQGAAAGVRGRAPDDYSRGSGSVTEGGGRQRYRGVRRQE